MAHTIRFLAACIGALCVAAIVFGWLPGLQVAPSEDCGWLSEEWGGAPCVHDDGLRATIGLALTIPLAFNALVAVTMTWRPQLLAVWIWSVMALALAGLYLWLRWRYVGFYPREGTPLWPGAAFGHVVRAIGAFHATVLVLPAIAAVRRPRQPCETFPRAQIK